MNTTRRKFQFDATKSKWLLFLKEKISRYTAHFVLVVSAVISTALMFPSRSSVQFSNLKVGDVYTGSDIIAPYTFFINKSEEETQADRRAAAERVPLVYVRQDSLAEASLKEFDDFFQSIALIRRSNYPDSLKLRRVRDILDNDRILIDDASTFYFLDFPESRTTSKQRTAKSAQAVTFDVLRLGVSRVMQDIYAIGILDQERQQIPDYVEKISLVSTEKEYLESVEKLYTLDNYQDVVLGKLRLMFPENPTAVKLTYPIATAFLRANVIFDKESTDDRIRDAVASVPLSKGIVLENERIINSHERITPQILEKLTSLASAKAEQESRAGGIRVLLPYVGKFLIVSLAMSFSFLFLFVARRELLFDLRRLTMLLVILMLVIAITFFINQFGFSSNLKFLIPISLASMLLAIFFDVRTSFIGTVTLCIIIGAMRGNDFEMMVISLFVGTLSTFSVREIQARSWILKGILFIAFGYLSSTATLQFLTQGNLSDLLEMWAFALINSVLSPILAYGLMVIFEYIFQMTTNSTLLELSDLNKPLLRDLAIRAPGTYHHSIMVGNLSEGAAEVIGANALLARVSSYYHDIGKMEKAEYFVENQKGGKNPHDKLAPSMSCLILINHVKKGMEIAEEHNLPQEIRNFIQEHHGTNLIKFFYHKAKKSMEDEDVSEANFRYPGPKPQSKETAIVMLADAVEAGSRTLREPTVSRIRSMVSSFINERLLDEELDECPLTLKDLKLIQESFVNTLTGMFHGRIEYPKQEAVPNSGKSLKAALEV